MAIIKAASSRFSAASMTRKPTVNAKLFDEYRPHSSAWDELFDGDGEPHHHCSTLVERLGRLTANEFQTKRVGADLVFVNQGITFSVYSDRRGTEKIFPFD